MNNLFSWISLIVLIVLMIVSSGFIFNMALAAQKRVRFPLATVVGIVVLIVGIFIGPLNGAKLGPVPRNPAYLVPVFGTIGVAFLASLLTHMILALLQKNKRQDIDGSMKKEKRSDSKEEPALDWLNRLAQSHDASDLGDDERDRQ